LRERIGMDGELIFRATFLALVILVIVVESYYIRRTRGPLGKLSIREHLKGVSRYEGRGLVALRAVLAPFWVAAIALYLGYPDWVLIFSLQIPTWLRWSGVGLALVFLLFMIWAYRNLGSGFSRRLQVRSQQRLVTSGPYRWIRHPLYLGGSAYFIGMGLESANSLIILAMITGVGMFLARISKEEDMMIKRFGAKYVAYKKRTGCLLPRL
jgi:protein-S-isoprenylcysteine O-methyltransferase Ste14